MHQAVGNSFQLVFVPVGLFSDPFDSLFVTMDVKNLVQPENISRSTSALGADGTELQSVVCILPVGLPKSDISP